MGAYGDKRISWPHSKARRSSVSGKNLPERGLGFQPIKEVQSVRGRLPGATQLISGRFAMIDDGFGFSLVPWRPVIEHQIGREVAGVMRGNDVSWQFQRSRGLGM